MNGYLKNNEYFGQIVKGYTRIGYQVLPELSYYPLKNLRIGLGGYFQKEFGDESFRYILPVFSIKYQIDSLQIIFGTLEGSLSHRLVEPLVDFEQMINDRIEEGLQIKWNKRSFYLDAWLDWQNSIKIGDPEQEEFIIGLNFRPLVFQRKETTWYLAWQNMVKHWGGQIDNSDMEGGSILASSIGISYYRHYNDRAFLKTIRSDNFYFISKGSVDVYPLEENSGRGLYLNLDIGIKDFNIMASYWFGENFFIPSGGALYQSVARNHSETGYTESTRELLFLRLMWQKQLKGGLSIGIRYEPFYDFQNHNFDDSQGLYLRYTGEFLTTTLNK
jgi:hypothetical protein